MKFAESWLRRLVPITASRAELTSRLTMAGLEVESVSVLGEQLGGVVIGQIVAAAPHPQADRLQVCVVEVAAGEQLSIVCGAPNARVGLKAPLARIGAELPGGMAIARASVRGVESFGMLCSASELGLSAEGAGLLELGDDAPVGALFADWAGLPDATIEIKLTPNRPDCLSLEGLAAEVAVLFDVPRAAPVAPTVTVASSAALTVVSADAADCPRYLGRVIEGIDPTVATPRWIAERLSRSGIRPLSVIVDCANYVMLETGQPLHAFDRERLHGAITVRRARAGESIRLLDEREVTLDPSFLTIADAQGPQAVAGIIGGFDSRVTDATRTLFLESAHFTPAALAGRARALGLSTDASHRFERGVDPALPARALDRLTELICAHAGGKAGPVVAAESPLALGQPQAVALRRARLARVLGITIADQRVTAILRGLDMQLSETADGWLVTPPSRRFDIAIEEDLIEEVVRIHGYDALPAKIPAGAASVHQPSEQRLSDAAIRSALVGCGYLEAINLAFLARPLLQKWSLEAGTLALANPLSQELAVMRPALLPGLVEALQRNQTRQQERVRLFELGRVFVAAAEHADEREHLALVACGDAVAEQWGIAARPFDWYDLRGDLQAVFERLGADAKDCVVEPLLPGQCPAWLHPGRAAGVRRGDQSLGYLGLLHPRLAKALDLDGDIHVAELALPVLRARALPRPRLPSSYPSVRRDLALVVSDDVAYAGLAAAAQAAAGPGLAELVLFDLYRGQGLAPGSKSFAIGLIFKDDSRTLTDPDVDAAVAAVIAACESRFGARLRG